MNRICSAKSFAAVAVVCLALACDGYAQSGQTWSQLRGSNGSGVAERSAKPPIQFNLENNVVWTTDLPGTGWSTPVYTKDLMWMTTSVSTKANPDEIKKRLQGDRLASIKTMVKSVELRALAVDKQSGKLVHNVLLRTLEYPQPINPLNSYASPTPAIQDEKVVCHFGAFGTWCLNATTGEKLWDTKYLIQHSVGPGSSPVIFDNKVVLVCDGTDKQFIAAVNLADGKEIWKTDRPPIRATDGEYRKAYCTPLLIQVQGKKQLVIPGAQWICGYDLETGKEIWRADHGNGFSVTPMPVYESGLVIFSTGYMKSNFVAVDPTGSGDVTETHIKWRQRGAPTMPSFIGSEGKIFSVSHKGILICLDAKTGSVLKKERVGGSFCSSPLLAGGHLYCADQDGIMSIYRCSSDLALVAKAEFKDGVMATPILVGDDLVVRTRKQLIRVKK